MSGIITGPSGNDTDAQTPPLPRSAGRIAVPSDKELILEALARSGMAQLRPSDIDFYARAYESQKLNYRDVRKIGAPMSSEQKAALGGKYRGILTIEFVATLNEVGRTDPALAAQMIAQPMSHLLQSAKDLRSAHAAGIEQMKFRFGGMAAGHCAFSCEMVDKKVPLGLAKPLPVANCQHPDQCGCRWQSWSPMMDEIGL